MMIDQILARTQRRVNCQDEYTMVTSPRKGTRLGGEGHIEFEMPLRHCCGHQEPRI